MQAEIVTHTDLHPALFILVIDLNPYALFSLEKGFRIQLSIHICSEFFCNLPIPEDVCLEKSEKIQLGYSLFSYLDLDLDAYTKREYLV